MGWKYKTDDERIEAKREALRRWRERNPERVKEWAANARAAWRKKIAAMNEEERTAIRTRVRQNGRSYRARNGNRYREYQRDYHVLFNWMKKRTNANRIEQLARYFTNQPCRMSDIKAGD